MVKSFQRFVSSLEPLLRRVVHEEVERGLVCKSARPLHRAPSLQIRAVQASTLTLGFSKKLTIPVFTSSKVEDVDNNPLQILLMDTLEGDRRIPTTLPYPIKVEIVVIDGDFPSSDGENWNTEQFNSKIVRERTGKRPLLTGDVNVTVRDGIATVGELSFTDNSSWIRSRKFRLGARVVPGSCHQGVKIREAMTEPFMVKDHRGELYKKHHPPSLEDDVWRLERIGKDGALHKKLALEGIHTVQDFLKLWVVDTAKLRRLLGGGLSEKKWEATIKHAKTCEMGSKKYIFRGPHYSLVLNPICQVVGTMLDGQFHTTGHGITGFQRTHVEQLIREAYMQWDSLEELEAMVQPTQTDGVLQLQYLNYHQNIPRINQHDTLITDTTLFEVPNGDVESVRDHWTQNSTYFSSQIRDGNVYNMSDDSSEGDLTSSRVYFN
ncbi:protein SAR DEFICIENT 1-like isoform X2 [Macadamia integrifolia]|nr:protein SAR DEFICIENT 1-like isoform X2 [Macadamia integrifolia]XP_042501588.1 protein SAR DEFICIENT 1-like isoform X2 [Macadamia integrifolia]